MAIPRPPSLLDHRSHFLKLDHSILNRENTKRFHMVTRSNNQVPFIPWKKQLAKKGRVKSVN
jgi:hypothetical protein